MQNIENIQKLPPIGIGIDSTVYLGNDGYVYKFYDNSKEKLINWYAELTTRLASDRTISLPNFSTILGQEYEVTASISSHEITKSNQPILRSTYIPGPSLIDLTQARHYSVIGITSSEVERLTILEDQMKANIQILIGIHDIVSGPIVEWINERLPKALGDHYYGPGSMNVKLSMPQDNLIHFTVTDLFASIDRYYLCYLVSSEEG